MVVVIFLIIMLIFPVNFSYGVQQKEQKQVEPYYKGKTKEGWWWYEDFYKEEKKQEPETKASPEEPEQKQAFTPKPLKEYTYDELLYMHPDEFSKLYDYYLKKAVQRPTEENVYEFYNLMDVARKKALLFSYYAGYVWQKYPELSTERDIPIVGPGIDQKRDLIRKELQKYKAKNASEYGYLVFVKPGCGYCDTQLKILRYAETDGVPIKIINVDENPLAAERFAVEVTPTIIVVDQKTGKYMPISAGVISLDEIYTRTARAIRIMAGESPNRYGIYEFQKGTSLDPLEPSPLWKKKQNQK